MVYGSILFLSTFADTHMRFFFGMIPSKLTSICFILLISVFSPILFAQDLSDVHIRTLYERTYLKTGWKIMKGDSIEYMSPKMNDDSWDSFNFTDYPHNTLKLYYSESPFYWLRLNFSIGSEIKGKSLGLYVGKIPAAAEVFINGSLIGSYGSMPETGYFENHNIPDSFLLPAGLLNWEGRNTLAFRIYSERASGLIEVPFITNELDQKNHWNIRYFLNSTVGILVTCIALFTALYYAILFVRNPRDYLHLFLAIGSVLIALDATAVYWSLNLLSRVTTSKIQKISFYFGTLFYLFFYQGYCKAPHRKVISLFLVYYLGLLSFVLLIPKTYDAFLKVNNYIYALYFSVLLGYLGILLVTSIKRKPQRKILYFFLGFTIFGITGVIDLVYVFLNKIPVCWLYPWGVSFFLIFSFLSSADLFIETSRQKQFISDFLRNISHEMRTPLNGILGCAEIVQDSSTSESVQQYSGQIVHESERLMQMINGLLDVGRIEAGVITLDLAVFNLRNALKAVFSSMQVLAEKKGITLSAQLADELPLQVRGDQLKLQQILTNIIGNSIKFTEKGYISVSTGARFKRTDEVELHFEIRDTGIGLSHEQVENLFEPFFQADNSMTKNYNGSGLGTTIAQQYARLMRGDILVESQEGIGSFFTIVVRLERIVETAQHVPLEGIQYSGAKISSDINLGLNVLAVEDYPLNQEIIASHLKKLGCTVTLASNGAAAVDAFNRGTYDLILMDIQMPVMDGIQATQIIRNIELKSGEKATPIVAMTANAFAQDVEACFKAGMNDVLTKPFKRDLFVIRIKSLLNQGQKMTFLQEPERVAVFDYEQLIQQWEDDIDTLKKIYQGFLEQSESLLKEIQLIFDKQDAKMLHRTVHTLKGGALNLFAFDLAEKAGQFEKELKLNILDKHSLNVLLTSYAKFLDESRKTAICD